MLQTQAVQGTVKRLNTVAQQAWHKADAATAKRLLSLDVRNEHAVHAFLHQLRPAAEAVQDNTSGSQDRMSG